MGKIFLVAPDAPVEAAAALKSSRTLGSARSRKTASGTETPAGSRSNCNPGTIENSWSASAPGTASVAS